MAHSYKNQLQTYAQKRKLPLPVYSSELEGPPHALRFRSKVTLGEKTYVCAEYFGTRKDAENAAAKVALLELSSDGIQEEDPTVFKNLLQQLAQKEYSCLPDYNTTWTGASHMPMFVSIVVINKESFGGQEAKTKKLAELNAAKVAYTALKERQLVQKAPTFSPESHVKYASHSSSPELQSTVMLESPQRRSPEQKLSCNKGSLSANSTLPVTPTSNVQQLKTNEMLLAASVSELDSPKKNLENPKEMGHFYKNQLQIYAQKRNISLPIYSSEREGPPHACRFRSKVILEEKTYKCAECFGTIKDAENAAAKVALMELSSDGIQEEDPAVFKTLLQELVQKEYSCLPEYNTTWTGASHMPMFVSTVEINKESFRGQEAKTKKLAEVNAAKVAYAALKERRAQHKSLPFSPGSDVNDVSYSSSPELQSTVTMESSQRQNPEPKLRCNKGALEKASVSEPVVIFSNDATLNTRGQQEPRCSANGPIEPAYVSDQTTTIEPWSESDASSSQKKIKVYPWTPNMTFPPGTAIVHMDDKWVALTSKPVHGDD